MIIRRDSALRIAFEGIDIYDYTAGKPGPSSVGVIEVPAGAGHRAAYSRRSDKYYYVVAGKLTFAVDGEKENLGPGRSLLRGGPQAFRLPQRHQHAGNDAAPPHTAVRSG